MADRDWYQDLRHAYPEVVEPLDERGAIPDYLYYQITFALGEHPVIDLVYPVEVADEKRFLLVRGDTAQLLRVDPSVPSTELVSLGSLVGGKLTERIKVIENGLEIELEYEHKKMLGKALKAQALHFEKTGRAIYLNDRSEFAMTRGKELRAILGRWSWGNRRRRAWITRSGLPRFRRASATRGFFL